MEVFFISGWGEGEEKKKTYRYPWKKRWMGVPKSRFGHFGEARNDLSILGIEQGFLACVIHSLNIIIIVIELW
jgi:hypothetical protein